MNFESLDEMAKKSWFVSRIIAFILIAITLITIRVMVNNIIGDKGIIFTIVIGIILFLLGVNAFIYPEIEYKQWKYSITSDSIELIHGIFFLEHTIIPIIRIQHIKTSQGPINKNFDLSTIEIYTAGGVHHIPELNEEKAEMLSRYIKDKVQIKAIKEMEGHNL